MGKLEGDIVFRPFRESDLREVMNINLSCLPENYSSYFYIDLYKRFPKTFLVAEANGRLVGYIMCRIETGFSVLDRLSLVRKGHVVSIAVLEEYRKRGIGEELLQKAMKGMDLYGARECYLEVRVSNKPAINLYKKKGFTIVKTITRYYIDGESAYLMARRLP